MASLTEQQRQAVYDRGGRLLVSAAAGSGKTKVLVDRLMCYLLDEQDPANMDEFLLITYTKAAASELRGKIAAKLSELIAEKPENRHLQQQMQRLYLTKISTVHAFCGDILREYAYQMDMPLDFRVGDENECAELRYAVAEKVLDRAYDTAAEDPDFRAFVDTQGLGRNDGQVPDILLKVFDSARCHLQPDAWLQRCLQLLDPGQITDASKTEFGRFLLNRLHRWLDLQIDAMSSCVVLAQNSDNMEKPAINLADTLLQLQQLRKCDTWDQVVSFGTVDFGRLTFSKQADASVAERIKAARKHCKDGLAKQLRPFADDSAKVVQDLKSCYSAACGLVALVKAFETEYDRAKRSRRILDFGDLEHRMLDLLLGKQRTGPTAAAREIGRRFRQIMVDEYQDSNQVQDAIYSALSYEKQDLFMVGDVKQSIYQFRLADPGIFLDKYAKFLPAEQAQPGQDRKVVLSKNFRSGGGVLSAANDVFSVCMNPEVGGLYYGADEALYEGIPHTALGEEEAELYCIDVQQDTYAEEAAFVADKISQMLRQGSLVRDGEKLRPVRPEDIVILLRSPNSVGHHFQQALEKKGIRCGSGGVDLLKTEEIGDLRCLLQAIHNPRLDIPLLGAMASPIFGFTADDLARLRSGKRNRCVYESLLDSTDEKAVAFLETLSRLRGAMREYSLTGLLQEIWFETDLDDVYAAMENGNARRENLRTFFRLASEMEATGTCELGRFLEFLDNMQQKGLMTTGDQSAGAVSIMSIHKSKGLEFPVVFLCCLGREFNMESQRANVLCHKDLGLGLSAVDRKLRIRYPSIAKRAIASQIAAESVSEELRVLYVAMTRPKDRIIMTYASDRLEKDLQELVSRMDLSDRQMLIREAVCPGEWVLLTALGRTEAGELFALGGRPETVTLSEPLWKIRVVQATEDAPVAEAEKQEKRLPAAWLDVMRQGLSFRYSYELATQTPSKQTATQRKGREKDQEAASMTEEAATSVHQWMQPGEAAPVFGTEYGNAIHAVMQFIDFSACGDLSGVKREVQRLVDQMFITPEQGEMVDTAGIAAFFHTELGKKLQQGAACVREFKFSILEDADAQDPALVGEQILLQGVVDCAILEEDGITVIDFKTDRVAEETLQAVTCRYAHQVQTYVAAMERIYQKKVKASYLYFFRLGRFVKL